MPYLADTNIVFRSVQPDDSNYELITSAVDLLEQDGEIIYGYPQNMIEFHALATRPVTANGLGLTSREAREQAHSIESLYTIIDDQPGIYEQWHRLVDKYGVSGRRAFDRSSSQ